MHIPDGLIDPKVSYGLWGVAVAVLAVSFAKIKAAITAPAVERAFAAVGNGVKSMGEGGRRALTAFGEQRLYQMGMVATLVFSLQMFNFPVEQGTSGHLLGGVLAAVLLGPAAGALVIAAVLAVQAFFYADGGILALGANIINMAFFGSILGYYIYFFLKKIAKEEIAIAVAAWFSVILASLGVSFEIGLSGTIGLGAVVFAMLRVHALIGIGEVFLTLGFVWLCRKIFAIKDF